MLCNQIVLFLHFKFILCEAIAWNAHFLSVQKESIFDMCNWEICMFPFPHWSFLWQVSFCTERDIFQCKFFSNPFYRFVKNSNNWNLYSTQFASISSPLTLLPSICSVRGTSSGCLTLLFPFKTEHIIWNEEREEELT